MTLSNAQMTIITLIIIAIGIITSFTVICISNGNKTFTNDQNSPQIDTTITVADYDYGISPFPYIMLKDENEKGYLHPFAPAIFYYERNYSISYYCDKYTNKRMITKMVRINTISRTISGDPSLCININGTCQ